MLKVSEEKLGEVYILHLRGRIVNGSESRILRKAVLSLTRASVVALDLARVNGIDAGGLGLLLELREWARTNAIEFRLMNLAKLVQQVLEITRLDSVFEIASRDEAVSAAARVSPATRVVTVPCR